MEETEKTSVYKSEEELDDFISSKNLELYELIHKKGVHTVYEGLDPKLKSVYKIDALKQFVKNRTKRCSSNSNEKDPLKKSIPRISKAQLLVWELLKQVGKTYDDIFSEWYKGNYSAQKAPSVDSNQAEKLERIEEKIDYLVENLAVHDRVPLEKKYSNLYEFKLCLSFLVQTTEKTENWEDNTFLLCTYYGVFNNLLKKISKKNDIYKQYTKIFSEKNNFNNYTVYIIYTLFLIAVFFNAISNYTDSYKNRFKENDKVFDFEDATNVEEFRDRINDYKKTILDFIGKIQNYGISFNAKDCKNLYGVFKNLFENSNDIINDKDGNLAGSKNFRNDLRESVFFRKKLGTQYFMRIYMSEEKQRQFEAVMEWREKIVQEKS